MTYSLKQFLTFSESSEVQPTLSNLISSYFFHQDDLEVEKMIIELQQIVACNALKPSTSPHNNPTVSSAPTANSSPEELESTQRLDLVSPEEYLGRKTLNTIALSNCNQNSYNACAAKSEVPKATVNEVRH